MSRYKPKIKIKLLDCVNCVIIGMHPDHVELFYDFYARKASNYYFNPKFQLGNWDGNIRFFHKTGKTFIYLLEDMLPKLQSFGYMFELIDQRRITHLEVPFIDKDFFSHINDPDSGEPIELRYYQVDAVNSLIDNGGGIVIAGTGAGKAQPLDCKILTPDGWSMMEEIKLGDFIVTPENKKAKVIGIFPQGLKDVYKLTFHDGSITKACGEHLWKTKFPTKLHGNLTADKTIRTLDILDFLLEKETRQHITGNVSIPLTLPIEKEKKELPIDPYLLGALLGDGTLTNRSIVFSSIDNEIIEKVSDKVSKFDTTLKYKKKSKCDYGITKKNLQKLFPPSKNKLMEAIKTLSLNGKKSYDKFIPFDYINSSIEQRLELIRGLFDTDGTAQKTGTISFSTSSCQLAKNVQEIIWSLGGTCTITSKYPTYTYKGEKRKGKKSYTCNIGYPYPKLLFSLKRKKNRCHEIHACGRCELTRRVKKVEYIGKEETQCILIDDPHHLYITDDYIVTHNTFMNASLVESYVRSGCRQSITIVPRDGLVKQTKKDFINWKLDVGEYSGSTKDINHEHVISTWQALQYNPTILSKFDVVVIDECHGLEGKVLSELLNKEGKNIQYRFGLTGTLPKEESDRLSVLVGIGADVVYEIPAHRLIEENYLAQLDIDIYQLQENFTEEYDSFIKNELPEGLKAPTYKQFKDGYFPDWNNEKRHLQTYKHRLRWMADLIEVKREERKGNVFCLVDSIKFGKRLEKMVEGARFVYGKDKVKVREQIYDMFKEHDDLAIIANVQIAGVGLNIKRIFNLIFIDIGKSYIRVIQSIGRGLRKAKDKDSVKVIDVCSDLKYSKKHLSERTRFYREAKYPYKKRVVKYDE